MGGRTRITSVIFGVLDIETSTYYVNEEPVAVWLTYGVIKLYDIRQQKPIVKVRFRDWDTVKEVFKRIESMYINSRTLIYIHNLSYDGDYIFKNVSRPAKILSNSSHGLISATLEDFPGIELRCSFKLSMQSLRKMGEQLGYPKLDSDYRFILPKDEITKQEWEYCERDCDVVGKYILKVLLPEFGTLRNIPLTKTGRVRKKFNEHYQETECNCVWDLLPPKDCYQAMLDAFAGGIVIGNPMFAGRVLYDVDSFDIKSSYPYAMLMELYPYTIEREYKPTKSMLQEKFWIAKIMFINIRTKFTWGWLSQSKMNDGDSITADFYNGKLLNAAYVTRTITNIDYELITKTYFFDDIEVLEFYHMYEYDTLPSPYIETIKDFATQKYDLSKACENVAEDDPKYLEIHIAYMLSKNDFNGIYGMSVQKLVQEEYYLDEQFVYRKANKEYVQSAKHMHRNFLFGIYICAYARRNLIRAILLNHPERLLYTDTDSVKLLADFIFHGTNRRMKKKFRNNPALRKLGIFEHDAHYDKFVYWGAKKYAYEKHGKVYTTVAGLPKTKGSELKFYRTNLDELETLTHIEQFHPPMIFKDCKMGNKYIYLDHSFDSEDGFDVLNYKQNIGVQKYLEENGIKTNGGVALFKVSYSLDITKVDRRVINECQGAIAGYLKVPTNQNIASRVSLNTLLSTT